MALAMETARRAHSTNRLDYKPRLARIARALGAVLASAVAYIMGAAFAYSPIEIYSDAELLAVMAPALVPSTPGPSAPRR
ncbi:MAG: hypothetical protein AAGH87_06485 [Pseudomonadota bacterium]